MANSSNLIFWNSILRLQKGLFEYDVMADGKRFLIDTDTRGVAATPLLNVEVNWDARLKK
jgi:hypothetical protein